MLEFLTLIEVHYQGIEVILKMLFYENYKFEKLARNGKDLHTEIKQSP